MPSIVAQSHKVSKLFGMLYKEDWSCLRFLRSKPLLEPVYDYVVYVLRRRGTRVHHSCLYAAAEWPSLESFPLVGFYLYIFAGAGSSLSLHICVQKHKRYSLHSPSITQTFVPRVRIREEKKLLNVLLLFPGRIYRMSWKVGIVHFTTCDSMTKFLSCL